MKPSSAETVSFLASLIYLIFDCNLSVTGLIVEDWKADGNIVKLRSFLDEYAARKGKQRNFDVNVCENFAANMYSACKSYGATFDEGITTNEGWGSGGSIGGSGLDADRATPVKPPLAQMWQTPPDALDWRTYNVVSPVKNEESCRASVYFAVDAGAESSVALFQNGRQIDLSEQAVVDCSYRRYGSWNGGCGGGNVEATLRFLTEYGFAFENEYPYVSGKTQTHYQCKLPAARKERLRGYWRVSPPGNENALKAAVASYGPVAVYICVNSKFQKFGRVDKVGIFEDSSCTVGNHGALVVGYGHKGGKDFWLLKNSWGTSFGDHGYFRIRRNAGNMLGIANDAYYMNA